MARLSRGAISKSKNRHVFGVLLDGETRRMLDETAQNGSASGAIRRALADSLSFFGLPAPARESLLGDMRGLGMESQRDYMVWLLMERLRHLRPGVSSRADGESA